MAAFTLIALIAGGVALYAWIQGRGADEPQDDRPLFATLAPGDPPVETGDVASAFSVQTLDGGTFSLADHVADDGRPVFLNLWASWCFPCRAEMPAIDAASLRHPGVKFVGVAVEDRLAAAADFADEIGVSYTLAFDTDGVVADGYPFLGLPATFLISGEGVLLKRVFGQVIEEQIDAEIATFFGG